MTIVFISIAGVKAYQKLKIKASGTKAIVSLQNQTTKEAFNRLHDGPLQTLYFLKRNLAERELSKEETILELNAIGEEIREICKFIEAKSICADKSCFCMKTGQKLNLENPIGELFYQIYFIL